MARTINREIEELMNQLREQIEKYDELEKRLDRLDWEVRDIENELRRIK